MKKFLLPSFIFFISLSFCFTKNVSASNLNINNYYYKFDSNLPLFLQNFDVIYNDCSSRLNCFVQTSGDTFLRVIYSDGMTLIPHWNNNTKKYEFEIRYSNINNWNTSTNWFGNCTRCNTNVYVNSFIYSTSQDGLLWTYAPLYYDSSISSIDTLTLPAFTSSVFNDCSIPSVVINNGDPIPTYYSLYHQYCETPPDETPILTNFYTLSINKLSFITEYFSSNYLYLSIFVVFILIFFIYLIKRRLY